MTTDRIDKSTLYPALAGFFIMGFCDIVAPITGKIAEQYADHATLVGFLPSMVFLWLFLISTPLASLANRYGRKSVALAGYAFTVAGLARAVRAASTSRSHFMEAAVPERITPFIISTISDAACAE